MTSLYYERYAKALCPHIEDFLARGVPLAVLTVIRAKRSAVAAYASAKEAGLRSPSDRSVSKATHSPVN
jgi:hypothetical protein